MLKCPVCGAIAPPTNKRIIAQDGGSILCTSCGNVYHKCKYGYQVGSPGQALCSICSANPNVKNYSKSSEVVCPQCELPVPPEYHGCLDDGGNTLCPYCKCEFHICRNGYKVNGEGPAFCPDCRFW